MAAIALAARLLGISPAVAQVIAIMIGIALVLGSAWSGYEYIKHRGAEEVRDQIEDQNNDAAIKGGEARMSLDECIAAHRVYDFRRGVCSGASSSPGE